MSTKYICKNVEKLLRHAFIVHIYYVLRGVIVLSRPPYLKVLVPPLGLLPGQTMLPEQTTKHPLSAKALIQHA